MPALKQRLAAEALGSALLLATIVGSGIMAEQLAGGNEALALLGNALPTGAMLVVLITMLGPISGAHFNPVVTLVFLIRQQMRWSNAASYVAAQIAGACLGVVIAHAMFDLPLLQLSGKVRSGLALGISEWVAAFGLITTILLTLPAKPDAVAKAVGLYIVAAYWFTASTSFANPAVTIARTFSDTYAGIQAGDVPLFVTAQVTGAVSGLLAVNFLLADQTDQ